ncbi:MAG: STAS domain-containing protein [Nitrospinota bacterium]
MKDSGIQIVEQKDVSIISFSYPIEYQNVSNFLEDNSFKRICKIAGRTKKLIIDMSNIEYLDCAAIGKIVILNQILLEKKGILELTNINKDISELIFVIGLDRFLQIYDKGKGTLDP